MHITAVAMHNFGPFKGTHRIELAPQVYAVVAEHDANAERSNWLGKTTFLAAIKLALYGKHHWDAEDDWITDGESSGMVGLELSTGLVVTRHRKRGAATQLQAGMPPRPPAIQAKAQELIDLHLGMDANAASNGPFIEQKQIARLVVAKPAERTTIINGWLDLGPLQAACESAKVKLATAIQQDEQLAASLNAYGPDGEFEVTTPLLARVKDLTAQHDAIRNALARGKDHTDAERDAAEFAAVVAKGRQVASSIEALTLHELVPLQQAASDAHALHADARATWADLNAMDRDGFDGQCPILCATCPSKEEVADRIGEVVERLPEAEQEAELTMQARDAASAAYNAQSAAHDTRRRSEDRLVELRAQATKLQPATAYMNEHGPAPMVADQVAELVLLADEISGLRIRIAASEKTVADFKRVQDERGAITIKRKALADEIRTWREAVAVLGRGGVQREIAEESMGTIEDRANTLLANAGVDLTIQVRWAREGNGLAANCHICGAPYPKGRGVKECDTCGATRGPKMIEKTHFKMSNRSGAADDMGGLAFQLAAASWQREAKGMVWSTVLIDEPFGACDPANAKAMGVHLHSMIRGGHGFEQGFIVAHDARVMESMPARVVVRSDGKHARLEVM